MSSVSPKRSPKVKAKPKTKRTRSGLSSSAVAPNSNPASKNLGAALYADIAHFYAGAPCMVEQASGAWCECALAGENGDLFVRYSRSGVQERLDGRCLCEQWPVALSRAPKPGDAVLVGCGAEAVGEWWPGVVLGETDGQWFVAYGKLSKDFDWVIEEKPDNTKGKFQVKIPFVENGVESLRYATLNAGNAKVKSVPQTELRQALHWLALEGTNKESLKAAEFLFSGPFIANSSLNQYAGSICSVWFASARRFATQSRDVLTAEEFDRWKIVSRLDGEGCFSFTQFPVSCRAVSDGALLKDLGLEKKQIAIARSMSVVSCNGSQSGSGNLFEYVPLLFECGVEAFKAGGATDEVLGALSGVMAASWKQTPLLFAAGARAIEKAVILAPEAIAIAHAAWQSASRMAADALDSDAAMKVSFLCTQFASQVAAFANVAMDRGAPLARSAIAGMVATLTDPDLAKDVAAQVAHVFKEIQKFVPDAELARLGEAANGMAGTLGEGFESLAKVGSSILPQGGDGGGGPLQDAQKLLNTAVEVAGRDGGRLTKAMSSKVSQAAAKVPAKQLQQAMSEVVRVAKPQLVAALQKASAAAAAVQGGEHFGQVRSAIVEQVALAHNAARYLMSMDVVRCLDAKEIATVASTAVVKVLQQAAERGTHIPDDVLAAATSAAKAGETIPNEVLEALQGVMEQIISGASDIDAADVQRFFYAVHQVCPEYGEVSAKATGAVEAAISAGRQIAPVAGAVVEPGVGQIAELSAGAWAAAKDAANKGLPKEWRDAAGVAAASMQKATAEACAIVGPAAAFAGAAVVTNAVDVAGQVAGVAGQAAEAVKQGAEAMVPVGQQAASIIAGAWDDANLDDAYTMTADAAAVAVSALASGAACACLRNLDLLNFEIVRDFYQVVALFFAKVASESYTGLVKLWGFVGSIFAIDISYVIPSFPVVYAFVAVGIVAVVAMIISIFFSWQAFKLMPDALEEGLECVGWSDLQETHPKTLNGIKYNLLLLISIHTPLSRMAIQVLVCKKDDEDIKELKKLFKIDDCTGGMKAGGALLLLLVGLGVPAMIYYFVQKSKPNGSPKHPGKCYDKDGVNLIDFTDDMYNGRVENDFDQKASPFVDLYRGFERKWAFHKVIMMIFKMALAAVVVCNAGARLAQVFGSLGLLVIYTAITFYSTPFINPDHDRTELSGKIANISNLILGSINHKAARIGVMLVMCLETCVLLYYTLMGFDCSRAYVKSLFGTFTFKDTCQNREGSAEAIVPSWDLDLEVQHRIWWPFWDGILINCYEMETAARFLDLKRITENEGRPAIERHFSEMSNPQAMEARKYAMTELEGVDCYWDGVSHDGSNDSSSKFGKMYIKRYPFECVVIWDDAKDHAFLSGFETIQQLNAKNQEPEVQAKRQVRWELRALWLAGQQGQLCHREFERDETRTVDDGTETYRDSEGNEKTRKVRSTITVRMYYHNGKMCIGSNTDKHMSAGFNVSLAYTDGHGEGRAPRTGEVKRFDNQSANIGADELGFGRTWERVGSLADFLADPPNKEKAQANLPAWHAQRSAYVQEMQQHEDDEENLLPSSFWLQIYAQTKVTREACEKYFSTCPGDFKDLPAAHAKGLDYVFGRMGFANSSAKNGFWYVFFDDLWNCNKNMTCMQSEEVITALDPRNTSAICYKVMKQEELDANLSKLGLRSKRWKFNDALINLLFQRLAGQTGAGEWAAKNSVGAEKSNGQSKGLGYSRLE